MVDQRLYEGAKEAGHIRLPDEQLKRELDGVALNSQRALRSSSIVDLTSESRPQSVEARLICLDRHIGGVGVRESFDVWLHVLPPVALISTRLVRMASLDYPADCL